MSVSILYFSAVLEHKNENDLKSSGNILFFLSILQQNPMLMCQGHQNKLKSLHGIFCFNVKLLPIWLFHTIFKAESFPGLMVGNNGDDDDISDSLGIHIYGR